MKKRIKKTKRTIHNKKFFSGLSIICWIVVPLAVITLLILEGLGLYRFTTERLIVLGVGILIILLPFFSEITVKNISVKRNK